MLPETFAYRSFRQEKDVLRRFCNIGVNTVCIFPAHTTCSLGIPYSGYAPTWLGDGYYDFTSLDQQIEDILTANPNAQILCMIDLNAPEWWVRAYAGHSQVSDPYYSLGKVAASNQWRNNTRSYLQAFLKHAQEKYAPITAGYILACGGTCEWQDRSLGMESPSRQTAWRKWMQDKGLPDPMDIPPQSVRDNITHDLLRDPQADAIALKYWQFTQELIGETILCFALAAQDVLRHSVSLGVFYGYILELGQFRLISEGHLDYDRVFASDDIDFIIAPATYTDRGNGGAGGFLPCTGTIERYGKVYLHEIDHRTHTAELHPAGKTGIPLGPNEQWKNTAESVAGIKREFSLSLIENCALWWFDMFGKFYDAPAVMNTLKRFVEIWNEFSDTSRTPAAQVAIIADPQSALYLDQSDTRVNELYYLLRAELGRMGTPYRCYSTSDIPHIDWARYKLIIFPALYCVDTKLHSRLMQYICKADRTVVWVDRPGVINGKQYNLSNVNSLTGLLPSGEITKTNMNDWTSVLSPLGGLTRKALRQIAKNAGVHIYCNSHEPIYASDDLLAIHTSNGGERVFKLPRKVKTVQELYSGRLVAHNTDTFRDTLMSPDTKLYHLID